MFVRLLMIKDTIVFPTIAVLILSATGYPRKPDTESDEVDLEEKAWRNPPMGKFGYSILYPLSFRYSLFCRDLIDSGNPHLWKVNDITGKDLQAMSLMGGIP